MKFALILTLALALAIVGTQAKDCVKKGVYCYGGWIVLQGSAKDFGDCRRKCYYSRNKYVNYATSYENPQNNGVRCYCLAKCPGIGGDSKTGFASTIWGGDDPDNICGGR
ncbi:hypothetical protein TCAL_11901 [Tigriopus californicus]|uniref:WSC domain-containing protein n=1 Tax=Tigriopus californicus TaxID=6832 RepID=A0A553PJI9_TIGCA|nr:hypothetical protein TCAL_11901 [Tigriopus californicus]|eukprot:TCALIF_11901-PA protein Name:"Protein of unknown function" AED:0.00 eAED:0.00 QI:24/1/1/1/1/1/2/56/109